MHVCLSVCLYVCMSVCLYVCMNVWTYECMNVWMYECMNVYIYKRIHIDVSTYIWIYIHASMYINYGSMTFQELMECQNWDIRNAWLQYEPCRKRRAYFVLTACGRVVLGESSLHETQLALFEIQISSSQTSFHDCKHWRWPCHDFSIKLQSLDDPERFWGRDLVDLCGGDFQLDVDELRHALLSQTKTLNFKNFVRTLYIYTHVYILYITITYLEVTKSDS